MAKIWESRSLTQNCPLEHHADRGWGWFFWSVYTEVSSAKVKRKIPHNFRGKYLALKKPRLDINAEKKLFHVDALSQPIASMYTLNHSFYLYDLAPQILLNYMIFITSSGEKNYFFRMHVCLSLIANASQNVALVNWVFSDRIVNRHHASGGNCP